MDGVAQQMSNSVTQKKKIRGGDTSEEEVEVEWRWSQKWSQLNLWLRSFQMWWVHRQIGRRRRRKGQN